MAHTFFSVYVHVVFSTRRRTEYLTDGIENELFPYLASAINNHGCRAILVGGYANHVHALVSMGSHILIADLVKEIKRTSSIWLKTKGPRFGDFAWQDGYGAFSVSFSNMERVKKYIVAQPEHHKKMTWAEECEALLVRHGVEFDRRFFLD